jgi:hypothetical protein
MADVPALVRVTQNLKASFFMKLHFGRKKVRLWPWILMTND